jgi:hypothetical protein
MVSVLREDDRIRSRYGMPNSGTAQRDRDQFGSAELVCRNPSVIFSGEGLKLWYSPAAERPADKWRYWDGSNG